MAIGMVILGVVAGAFSLAITNRLLSRAPKRWIKRWLKPPNGNVDAHYLLRTASAITITQHSSLFWPLSPIFTLGIVLLYWALFGFAGVGQTFWPFVGFLVTTMAGYPLFIHGHFVHLRRKVACLAAKELARHARPEDAGAILIPASEHSDSKVRLAAAEGLRELGTNSGIAALKKLCEDQNPEVAAKARDALADLLPALQGASILSVRTMDTYVEEHKFLTRQLGGRNPKDAAKTAEKLDEITQQIEEIVYSQLSLRRAYPDLFCEDCYARAEDLHYEDWEWVRCKQCKEVHGLRVGVQKVIGEIGGNHETANGSGHLEKGVLRVSLWNAQAQKARYGEVDVLEIIGGQGINYDWAISAVIEKMHNQNHGPLNMISVKLVGSPRLEVNTLHLLRTLDPGVMG